MASNESWLGKVYSPVNKSSSIENSFRIYHDKIKLLEGIHVNFHFPVGILGEDTSQHTFCAYFCPLILQQINIASWKIHHTSIDVFPVGKVGVQAMAMVVCCRAIKRKTWSLCRKVNNSSFVWILVTNDTANSSPVIDTSGKFNIAPENRPSQKERIVFQASAM